MDQKLILHNSQLPAFRSPFGAVSCSETITLRLKLDLANEPQTVELRLWNEGRGEEKITMSLLSKKKDGLLYETVITAPANPGLIWYYFIIESGGVTSFYGNNQDYLGGEGQLYNTEPPSFQITVYKAGTKTPEWLKEAVIYQIMPDRFYNGEPGGVILNPKKGSLIHAHWDNIPFYIREKDNGKIMAYDFFGGNLRGIMAKLPYLQELGVTAIYLNPIFEAPSNHRYDTSDYHRIDGMLGSNELFAELCAEAGKCGMVIILDGVFSHTGSDSIYFNREGRYPEVGAYQSKASPYYKWYNFNNWPNDYQCWWGVDNLPNVNETEPTYMNYIISGDNSVLKHWMRLGVKGWRLDVVDELPSQFVKEFRQTMKDIDPEAAVIGEVWEDASHKVSYGEMRHYLGGEEIDSAMNYPFRQIVIDFLLGNKDAVYTHKALMSLYENYPRENFYAMMNLLGSHDVTRILTLLAEAPPPEKLEAAEQAKYRLPPDKIKLGLDRLKLAVLWQMTFPGAPSVYYGDEAGLQGYKDPFNRGTFPWGKENQELLSWHKTLIALRHKYDALRTGEWQLVIAEGDVYGYVRFIENGKDVFGKEKADNSILILFNRNVDKPVNLNINVRKWCRGILIDVLDDNQEIMLNGGLLAMTLQPSEGKILVQREELAFPRQSGILLHPTSLPSRYGIGDVGKEAYDFINFLAKSKQKLWQVLPINPVGFGESPYQCLSAFAGNHMLIALGKLVPIGLLSVSEIKSYPACDPTKVDYDKVKFHKDRLLRVAFRNFRIDKKPAAYSKFITESKEWLEDYALFMALKNYLKGAPWYEWPKKLAMRDEDTLDYYRDLLAEEVEYHRFLQYIFFRQWQELKLYANRWGIKLIGDIPIFVAHDSSDVWANPQLFKLDENNRPIGVAGVPPDYFSKTGQLWGNPIYNWAEMAKDDYKWWRNRFEVALTMTDIVRIDHFRGIEAYWEIPAGQETAENGQWIKGPGGEFFATIRKYFGNLSVIAEDLGVITPEVEDLKAEFNLPGMKVLHFSLGSNAEGQYKPFVIEKNSVLYTGTHDNDTTVGWYKELTNYAPEEADCVRKTVKAQAKASAEEICDLLVEFAYASNANTVIIPLQDLLKLGSETRMNRPGTVGDNWQWRCLKVDFTPELTARLAELAAKHKR